MSENAFGPAWSASLARVPEATLREWLALALEACDVADKIAMEHFRRDLDLERKPDRSFVTIADQGIEREIRAMITARYPSHGLVGEEYGTADGDAPTRWYIDPIDGTHNFIRGVPLFGTLIGVEHDGELQVGVISAPAMRQRWFAYRGGGAWSRGLDGERQIHVSRVKDLADSQLLYGSSRETARSGLMPGFDSLISDAWRERGFGDFWQHMLVAQGAVDIAVDAIGLEPYDIAALVPIVHAAGGTLTDRTGTPNWRADSAISTNTALHNDVIAILNS